MPVSFRQTLVVLGLILPPATPAPAQAIPGGARVPPQRVPAAQPGAIIRVDSLGRVNRATLAGSIDFLPEPIAVATDVDLYRVVYWTRLRSRMVPASGLLVAPAASAGATPVRGVVTYLHGTNVTRALAPSQPDRVDGNQEAAIFGANGYYVVLPDYIGLGESTAPQPFLIVQPQVDATLDLLQAVRQFVTRQRRPWSDRLMLVGFSQGGQSVAGVQRALEQTPHPGYRLIGSAAIAGAYALRTQATPYALANNNTGYLAFAAYAYAIHYGHPLTTVFADTVASRLPTLLDGSKTIDQILPQLPNDIDALFTSAFATALRSGSRMHWFNRALDENALDRWVPRAPLRLYNGSADPIISPQDAHAFARFAAARGGAVTQHDVGAFDHQETLTRAYGPVKTWFDSLTARR